MTQDSLPVGRKAESSGNPAAYPADAPTPLHPTRPTHAMITWLLVGTGYALIAGSLRRLTAPAELATLLPGAALVWYAMRPATPHFPAPDHIDGKGALPWAAVAVVFGIWELYAAVRGSTPAHPTLSILMGPLIDPPFARAAGYALWLAVGVWVVRR
ncbi:hypothetical protein GCM10009839_10400 [Catenulispora yoronensis]|uniref:Integral membrane protein n=1 Tax=Catenulispora yoronensis TaxID=450799 RepID=A0ABP5F6S9_9ACTN